MKGHIINIILNYESDIYYYMREKLYRKVPWNSRKMIFLNFSMIFFIRIMISKYFDPHTGIWMLMRFWSTWRLKIGNSKKTITSKIPILIQFQITQRCILIQFHFESGSKTRIRINGSKIEILENIIIFEKKSSEF